MSEWDGVVGLPSGAEQPFYRMIPDTADCIKLLGGPRGVRYVAQENLEALPSAVLWRAMRPSRAWLDAAVLALHETEQVREFVGRCHKDDGFRHYMRNTHTSA